MVFDARRIATYYAVMLAVPVGLVIVLPFPFGLVCGMAFTITVLFVIKKVAYNGPARLGGWLTKSGGTRMSRTCLACGNPYTRGAACPRCGSGMWKPSF